MSQKAPMQAMERNAITTSRTKRTYSDKAIPSSLTTAALSFGFPITALTQPGTAFKSIGRGGGLSKGKQSSSTPKKLGALSSPSLAQDNLQISTSATQQTQTFLVPLESSIVHQTEGTEDGTPLSPHTKPVSQSKIMTLSSSSTLTFYTYRAQLTFACDLS